MNKGPKKKLSNADLVLRAMLYMCLISVSACDCVHTRAMILIILDDLFRGLDESKHVLSKG